jgi:hypothetical protein
MKHLYEDSKNVGIYAYKVYEKQFCGHVFLLNWECPKDWVLMQAGLVLPPDKDCVPMQGILGEELAACTPGREIMHVT